MPVTVRAFAQYLTSPAAMRGADYAGLNFINCLKKKPFIGQYSEIPFGGKMVRINKDSEEACLRMFSSWACDLIIAHNFSTSVCLVPVPNKSAVAAKPEDDFPTALLARRLMATFSKGVSYHPALRWDEPLVKAREGGPRAAWQLYPHLVFSAPPPTTPKNVILVDDVCTSGGHLQACAAKLKAQGYDVRLAICAGKTCDEQQADPFDISPISLPDYDPNGWSF